MTIDSVTAVQFSGYFQKPVRQMLEQGKIAEETREAIFQKKLEEERKRIQPLVDAERKTIENNQPRGYDSQGRLVINSEDERLGKKGINLLV